MRDNREREEQDIILQQSLPDTLSEYIRNTIVS